MNPARVIQRLIGIHERPRRTPADELGLGIATRTSGATPATEPRARSAERAREARPEPAPNVSRAGDPCSGEMRLVRTALRLAAAHDGPTLEAKQRVRAAFTTTSSEREDSDGPTWWFPHEVETSLEALRRTTTTLCALLAPAARDRVQPLVLFADRLTEHGALETMDRRGMDALVRPVFEAAGVPRRFVADTPPNPEPLHHGIAITEAPPNGKPMARTAPPTAPAAEAIAAAAPPTTPAAKAIAATAPPLDGDALLEHLLTCRERISYGAAHRALVGPVSGTWSLKHYAMVRQIVRNTAPRLFGGVEIRLERLLVSKKSAPVREGAEQQRHEGDALLNEAASWGLCTHAFGAAEDDRQARDPSDSATQLPRSAELTGDPPTGVTTTA